MKLKLYVGTVAALATVTTLLLRPDPTGSHDATRWELALMAVLIALAEALQIRYRLRGNINAFNLMEGILAPLIFVGGGRPGVIACAAAILVGDCTRRNQPIKVVFNVAQWTLAVAAASFVFRELRVPEHSSPTTLIALVAALLTVSAVNQLALNTVLYLATGRAFGAGQPGSSVIVGMAGHGVAIVTNLVAGICLCAAYMWQPLTLFAGFVLVFGAYAAGQAAAALRADTVRLEGMQRATHALGSAMDAETGLQQFIADVRIGFEVEGVELALVSDRGVTVYACRGDAPTVESVCVETHPLAEAIAARIVEPHRYAAEDDSDIGALLAATRHNRVLAAPLRTGGTTIGVLFLFDRVGMEGFEQGELKIADTLAREVVGFLERATLLQAIDEERRKLADILGNTSDGIFSIAADGTITSWNAGLATMTGYVADEIVGTRHFGMLRPRDSIGRDVLVERWLDLIETPGALPTDLQIVSAAGETVWLSCSYSRIADGASSGDVLVVVARNVTQARELERLKDDFVAVVSHELRTPLVPIKGWAQTLLNRGDRLNDDQRRTAVQSILSQAQKLESLVLNILEASRIEAGRVDNEGVADVVSITARLVDDTLSSRPDRQIRLRPPAVPCQIKGSAVWVERAVSNLIANAIKYSPDEEPVDVVIAADGDDVTVSVTDRGPGIAVEAQERIFERFERLEETRKQTGTGLGLYITRRLARAMGGDVSVSSVPGAGSTFLLRLPMAPVSATPVIMPEQRADKAVGQNDGSNVVRLH